MFTSKANWLAQLGLTARMAAILACIGSFGELSAQNYIWDGGGANANWSTALNWGDNLAPENDGTATVTIQGSLPASLTSVVDTPFNIKYLRFNTGSAFNLNGADITVQGTSGAGHDSDILVLNQNNSVYQTINANLILAKGGALNGNLIINGNIHLNDSSNNGLRFTSGNVTVNGIISTATSADQVALNSNAVVTFNNFNTFTKGMTVWSGIARAGVDSLKGQAGAFGASSSAITMGHSNTTAATILTAHAVTIGRDITLVSSGHASFSSYTIGGDTAHESFYTGNIQNGKDSNGMTNAMALRLTAAAGGRVNFTGNIYRATTATGSNDNMRKIGQGVVAINGDTNNWEGETQVAEGILYVNGTIQSADSGKGVFVSSGATLGGNGLVQRSVSLQNGAILEAGDRNIQNGIGRYTIGNASGNALALNASGGSILSLQVTHDSAVFGWSPTSNLNADGTIKWNSVLLLGPDDDDNFTNDTLILDGDLLENSSGLTTIKLDLVGAGTLAAGTVWNLLEWNSVNGVNDGTLTQSRYQWQIGDELQNELSALGLTLDTSRFWDTGYVGVVVVPEPARMMLLMVGLTAWMIRRNRKSRGI